MDAEALAALVEAADEFDPAIGAFSTLVFARVRRRVARLVRAHRRAGMTGVGGRRVRFADDGGGGRPAVDLVVAAAPRPSLSAAEAASVWAAVDSHCSAADAAVLRAWAHGGRVPPRRVRDAVRAATAALAGPLASLAVA